MDLEGNPRNPKRAILRWDAENKKWVGDVPDGPAPPMGTEKVKIHLRHVIRGIHLYAPHTGLLSTGRRVF